MPPKHRKRQTFHSTFEEAEKYKPFGLKTRFPGADLLPAKLLGALHNRGKKLLVPVLGKKNRELRPESGGKEIWRKNNYG